MDPISVLIVEDDERFRQAFAEVVNGAADLRLVGAAADLPQGLLLLREFKPQVLLVDLGLPSGSGIELIRYAHDHLPQTDVMVVSVFGDEPHVMASLEAGATGYLLKDSPREELVRAIRSAARGEAVLAPSVASRLVSQLRAPEQPTLSDRELEVLRLVAQGETNRGVAARLFVSEATVKTHVGRVLNKLGCRDRVQAVVFAYRTGFATRS